MIINEAFSNQKEVIRNIRKLRVKNFKITCISTGHYPRVQSFVPNQCSDVAILSMVRHDDYLFYIFMNDNKNNRNVRKFIESKWRCKYLSCCHPSLLNLVTYGSLFIVSLFDLSIDKLSNNNILAY